jgi:hypothetical protein
MSLRYSSLSQVAVSLVGALFFTAVLLNAATSIVPVA